MSVLLVALLLFAIWVVGSNVPRQWNMRKYRGLKPAPFVGNLPAVNEKGFRDALFEWKRQFGDCFLFWFARTPALICSDPDLIYEFAVKQFKAAPGRFQIRTITDSFKRVEMAGYGMLNIKGGLWSTLRGAAQPMFHTESMQMFHRMMQLRADALCEDIDAHCGSNTPFDVLQLFGHFTLSVIIATAFGLEDTSPQHRAQFNKLSHATGVLLKQELTSDFYFALAVMLPDSWWPFVVALAKIFPGKRVKELRAADDVVLGACYGLMRAARRAAGRPLGDLDPDIITADKLLFEDVVPTKGSLIELMGESRNKDTGAPFKDEEIAAQVYTFLIAGHETSANTLAFTVYYVALNPHVEAKMRDELRRVLNGREAGYDDIEHLKYVEAVMKESQRLEPTATVIVRRTESDLQLSCGVVPRDTFMFGSIYNLHLDERYWSEPTQFKPERFLEGSGEPRNPRAYMPFGMGPRQCIGMKLAQQEIVLALSRLYSRYTFKLSKDHDQVPLKLRHATTEAPKDGLWVTVERVH